MFSQKSPNQPVPQPSDDDSADTSNLVKKPVRNATSTPLPLPENDVEPPSATLPSEDSRWHDEHRYLRSFWDCAQEPGDLACNNNFGPAVLDCESTAESGTIPVRVIDRFYDRGEPKLVILFGESRFEYPFDPDNRDSTEEVLTDACLDVRNLATQTLLDRELICGDMDPEGEECDDYIGSKQSKNWAPEKKTMIESVIDLIGQEEDFPYDYEATDEGYLIETLAPGIDIYIHPEHYVWDEGTDDEESGLRYLVLSPRVAGNNCTEDDDPKKVLDKIHEIIDQYHE